jgi:hypothetical protein
MDALGVSREGSNERDYEDGVARARALLSPADFESEWQHGCQLTFERALEIALRGES